MKNDCYIHFRVPESIRDSEKMDMHLDHSELI